MQITSAGSEPAARPLSYAQEQMFLLQQLDPGSCHYHIGSALRLEGRLNVGAMEWAFGGIVCRHAALRATFSLVDGRPMQVIGPPRRERLPVVDLQGLPDDRREATARHLARVHARQAIDLERGPLCRSALVALQPDVHVLVLVMHHIAADAWSSRVLARELSALYNACLAGDRSPLPELPLQYVDYAEWQRGEAQLARLAPHLEYWTRQLAGLSTLQLPAIGPRRAVKRHVGARFGFELSAGLVRRIRAVSRREDATLFMAAVTAFALVLHRYSGDRDVVIGTPVAGRGRTDVEGLIGLFVNTIVLRLDLSGAPTVRQLLGRVRQVALEAYEHQDLPFEKLVEALQPDRDLSRTPVFQVMLTLQNVSARHWSLSGLTARPQAIDSGTVKFDLQLSLEEQEGALRGSLSYNTDLFGEPMVARLAGHFRTLLEEMAERPEARIDDLVMLTGSERNRLLIGWNDTARRVPSRCIHELFEEQAAETPDAVAVVCGGEHTGYGELDRRANLVARSLRALGVGPDVRVGLGLEPSLELIAALLGILQAGGAYVPFDPTYPAERIAYMLADAGAAAVVTDRQRLAMLPEWTSRCLLLDDWTRVGVGSGSRTCGAAAPQNLVYVTYTSGSTGRPKGVAVEHRNLVNYVQAILDRMALGPGTQTALVSSIAADLGNTMLFPALLSGATLHLPGDACARDSRGWIAYNRERQLDCLKITPTHLAALMDFRADPDALPSELLVLGGEASPWSWVAGLQAAKPGCRLLNHYGPTECTVGAIACSLDAAGGSRGETVPLGTPLHNTRAYVVDAAGRPVPIWVPGELWIGGAGVARGYVGQPSMTAARFLPDPFAERPGARLYRTGDLVRWRDDGRLEFLGRADGQVKVRGYRVELGEIEATLAQHPAVERVVLAVREDVPGEPRLVAYVRRAGPATVSAGELRRFVRERLPEYMVPAAFVALEEIPLTPNGKIDRRVLPAPGKSSVAAVDASCGDLCTPTEHLMATLWQTVLRVERVGPHDNFFDLGGHSVLAMQLVSRVRQTCEIELTLRQVFEHPALRDFARAVDGCLASTGEPCREPLRRIPAAGELPLSVNQQGRLLIDWLALARGEHPGPFHAIRLLRLAGPLNVEALEEALNDAVNSHDALRSGFAAAGNGRPSLSPFIRDRVRVTLHIGGLARVSTTVRDLETRRIANRLLRQPFDYERPPLLRAVLLQIDGHEHVLIIVVHHLLCDGWAFRLFLSDLGDRYSRRVDGRDAPPPDDRPRYVDFAAWQRRWLTTDRAREAIQYWTDQWTELGPYRLFRRDLPFALPAAGRRSAVKEHEAIGLDPALSSALRAYARQKSITTYMLGLTAFQLVLHAYCGRTPVPVTGHFLNRTMPESEAIVGWLSHAHLLGVAWRADEPIDTLLRRVRTAVLAAHAHQEVPEARLWEILSRDRRARSHVLTGDVYVSFDLGYEMTLAFHDLSAERVRIQHATPHTALNVFVLDSPSGIRISCDYSADAFSQAGVRAMLGDIRTAAELMSLERVASAGSIADLLGRASANLLQTPSPVASAATASPRPRAPSRGDIHVHRRGTTFDRVV